MECDDMALKSSYEIACEKYATDIDASLKQWDDLEIAGLSEGFLSWANDNGFLPDVYQAFDSKSNPREFEVTFKEQMTNGYLVDNENVDWDVVEAMMNKLPETKLGRYVRPLATAAGYALAAGAAFAVLGGAGDHNVAYADNSMTNPSDNGFGANPLATTPPDNNDLLKKLGDTATQLGKIADQMNASATQMEEIRKQQDALKTQQKELKKEAIRATKEELANEDRDFDNTLNMRKQEEKEYLDKRALEEQSMIDRREADLERIYGALEALGENASALRVARKTKPQSKGDDESKFLLRPFLGFYRTNDPGYPSYGRGLIGVGAGFQKGNSRLLLDALFNYGTVNDIFNETDESEGVMTDTEMNTANAISGGSGKLVAVRYVPFLDYAKLSAQDNRVNGKTANHTKVTIPGLPDIFVDVDTRYARSTKNVEGLVEFNPTIFAHLLAGFSDRRNYENATAVNRNTDEVQRSGREWGERRTDFGVLLDGSQIGADGIYLANLNSLMSGDAQNGNHPYNAIIGGAFATDYFAFVPVYRNDNVSHKKGKDKVSVGGAVVIPLAKMGKEYAKDALMNMIDYNRELMDREGASVSNGLLVPSLIENAITADVMYNDSKNFSAYLGACMELAKNFNIGAYGAVEMNGGSSTTGGGFMLGLKW